MNVDTELLAHQMVQLEKAIKRAVKEHAYWTAHELQQEREHVVQLRRQIMREQWYETHT